MSIAALAASCSRPLHSAQPRPLPRFRRGSRLPSCRDLGFHLIDRPPIFPPRLQPNSDAYARAVAGRAGHAADGLAHAVSTCQFAQHLVLPEVHKVLVIDPSPELAGKRARIVCRSLEDDLRVCVGEYGFTQIGRQLAEVLMRCHDAQPVATGLGEHVSRVNGQVQEVLELVEQQVDLLAAAGCLHRTPQGVHEQRAGQAHGRRSQPRQG